MKGSCCLLHTPLVPQWTGIPGRKIFLHITEQLVYLVAVGFCFFLSDTELRQELKSRAGRAAHAGPPESPRAGGSRRSAAQRGGAETQK